MKPDHQENGSPFYLRSESDDLSEDAARSLQDDEAGDSPATLRNADKKENTGETRGKRRLTEQSSAHPEEKDFTD